jgi:hypothetical protein
VPAAETASCQYLRLQRGSGVRRLGLEGRGRGYTRWRSAGEGAHVASPLTISKFVEPRVGTLYVAAVLVSNEGGPPPRSSTRPSAPAGPAAFMEEWTEGCGREVADAWAALVEAAARSEFARLGHFPSGGPYINVASGSMEPVIALRLVDRKPLVRDQLHQGKVWEENQGAREARDRFRRTLVEQLPGAKPAGAAGRVEAPVVAFAERRDTVVKALSILAQELAGAVLA